MKHFLEYKANSKRKWARNREKFPTTGGGPSKKVVLTATEERLNELTQVSMPINYPGSAFVLTGDSTEEDINWLTHEQPEIEATARRTLHLSRLKAEYKK